MLRVILILFCCSAGTLFGQDCGRLLTGAIGRAGSDKKARLDSLDFQFAITVSENTGLIDASQKGEISANLLYLMRDEGEKTASERARDTLNAAIQNYKLRFYWLAESGFFDVKRMMERDGLTGEINYIRCISNIGLLAMIRGKTTEAEKYLKEATGMSLRKLGDRSAGYAANLNNSAKLQQLLGNYNEAEKLFNQSFRLVGYNYGETSLQAAIVQNNIAMLNLTMGRKNEAIQRMEKSSAAAAASFDSGLKGKKSFENRMFLSNLALVYQSAGKFLDAEKTFLEIKSIFEKRQQSNNPEYAGMLRQLALLYIKMGKPESSESLLISSLDIFKKKFTEISPAYASALHDLGVLNRITGRLTESETNLQKALTIRLKVLGDRHPDYAKSLEELGLTQWKAGGLAKAYQNLKASADLSISFINQYFRPMSEVEKTRYWELLQPSFQKFYAFAIDYAPQFPLVMRDVFEYQMVTKAILLGSTSKVKRAILSSADRVLIRDYNQWIRRKEELARLYSFSREDLEAQKINLKLLEQQANNLEKSLSDRSIQFTDGFVAKTTSFSDVASILGEGEMALEMIRLRLVRDDQSEEIKYLALAVKKGMQVPAFIVMDQGKLLETKSAKVYKNAIQQRVADPVSFTQYWKPLVGLTDKVKRIYFSADGVYNQINLNTIRTPEGNFVLDLFEVVFLGNPREVIGLKAPVIEASVKTAFLLGYPDYGGYVVPLPGTKVELEGVSKILSAAGYKINLRQQAEASEANIKLIQSPSIVHLATHGYFLADHEVGDGFSMGIEAENARSNPLLRSGLILSGAGRTSSDTSRVDFSTSDNGILTAYEAMNLNLEGTSLVVLSACETGLGEVKAGEGVYGLQRAFLAAGARSLVMSLWKVDDTATQELMSFFYAAMLKNPDRPQAFRSAQKLLMQKYPDPYYWGAFLLLVK